MAVKILNLTDFAKYRFGFAVSSHENSLKVKKRGYIANIRSKIPTLKPFQQRRLCQSSSVVEQRTHKPLVACSNHASGTIFYPLVMLL